MSQNIEHFNNSKDTFVISIFDKMEPFFVNIFGEKRKFTMMEKAKMYNFLSETLLNATFDFTERFWSMMDSRVGKEFDKSIEYLKQFPVDDNFVKHVEDERKKFDFAKEQISSLLEEKINAIGRVGINVSLYISKWDYKYLEKVNQTFNTNYMINFSKEIVWRNN